MLFLSKKLEFVITVVHVRRGVIDFCVAICCAYCHSRELPTVRGPNM